MRLKEIIIENYRSIKNLKISLEHNCLFFFGINETGKSNILKAISLLDPQTKYNYSEDCKRQQKKKTTLINYTFELEDSDLKEIANSQKELFERVNQMLIKKPNWKQILKPNWKLEFTRSTQRNGFLEIKLLEENIELKENSMILKQKYWQSTTEKKIIKRPGPVKMVGEKDSPLPNLNQYDEITFEYFEKMVRDILKDYTILNLPKIIIWKPEDKYLTTEPIEISQFSANPLICIPLQNIFRLSGYNTNEEIKNTIADAKEDFSQMISLTETLTKHATDYIHKTWPEYNKVVIDIRTDGNYFKITIRDSEEDFNFFNMKARSEGFKKFISFLLTLSIQSKKGKTTNTIILVDEPEQSLHPSGIKYFRDELVKLSNENYVFAASHSIFMVDRKILERNIIVEKENENTSITPASVGNIFREEIVFKAMGFNIFELIKEKNFLFEGETDRLCFEILNEKLKQFKLDALDFDIYGRCNAASVNKMPHILSFFADGRIKFICIVDDDKEGKKFIKYVQDNMPSHSEFLCSYDLLKHIKSSFTLEDFLPKNLFEEIVNHNINSDKSFRVDDNTRKGYIEQLRVFIEKNNIENFNEKKLKSKISSCLRDYLKEIDIGRFKADFSEFIKFIGKISKKLKIQ